MTDQEQPRCIHCGVEVRTIPYALGPELRHSPYPGHVRDAYRHCARTVATLPASVEPVQLELQ